MSSKDLTDADLDDLLGGFEINLDVTPAKPPRTVVPIDDGPPTVSDSITLSNFKDHAKKKGMWAGALKPIANPDLLGVIVEEKAIIPNEFEDEGDAKEGPQTHLVARVVEITRPHTPAVLKGADEIIVNASDEAKARFKESLSKRVTKIDITFDGNRIIVFNNGPGIPVITHAAATQDAGRDVYVPEVAFSYWLAGSNIDKAATNVKGGINGLGAKLCNVHSNEFTIDTTDGVTKRHYRQQWRRRMDEMDPPTVTNLRSENGLAEDDKKPHTRVSFIPAYKELGYKLGANGKLLPEDSKDIGAYLCMRAHHVAAYLGSKVTVTYNGYQCKTLDAATLGQLLLTHLGPGAENAVILPTQAKATTDPYKIHPWSVAVIVLPPGMKAGRRAASQNMTIINGVLTNKGSHIKFLKDKLREPTEDKLNKVMKKSKAKADKKRMTITELLGGVILVVCAAISGADWGGQRKDELQVPKETLAHYKLTAAFLKRAGDAIAERFLASQGSKRPKFIHDKYTKAYHAGKAQRRHTNLLVAEGDSALTLLRAGLTQKRKGIQPGGPSLAWNGMISIQGVIVNAAREVTANGEMMVRSSKLRNNKRLLSFADAWGLKENCKYETEAELKTLNYHRAVLCTDEDLDGKGKIAPLALVYIWTFHPNLIRLGRVARFITPLIRAKYGKKLKAGESTTHEFYSDEDLQQWLVEDPTRTERFKIKYYKGLATHDSDEAKSMFTPENFAASIYTYTVDDVTTRLFEVYYGSDASLRKEALATPVQYLSTEVSQDLRRRREIPVGRVQLEIDSKSYKNDAIKRQIPGGADGLNPARRKILMGAIMRFAAEAMSKELKVFQLGGFVADKLFYHHGDASLNGTIIYMANAYIGGRAYPFLIGVGQFASRHGDDAGSARYISVKLSPLVAATFPSEDRWHLSYVFEDGDRAEPQYFAPVAPMAVLESYQIVSEGWNHNSFGRDQAAVLAIARAYINGDADLLALGDRLHAEGLTPELAADIHKLGEKWPLPASTRGFDGEVRPYRGEDYSFGCYEWESETRTIIVTDLPIGVTTKKYIKTLTAPGREGKPNARDEYVESIDNQSSETKVELLVKLRTGAFDKIVEKFGNASIDPIEDALMLRASLRPHLNYYSTAGGVVEFGSEYLTALLYWAPVRRDLYETRITRRKIVTELRILEETEILRYIGLAVELDLARVEDDDIAAAMLEERKFPRLHRALLHAPKYTKNEDLHRLVTTGPGANYNYLLDLRERDLVKKSAIARQKRLDELKVELTKINALLAEQPIPGASLWHKELDNFEAVVARGIATGWKYK